MRPPARHRPDRSRLCPPPPPRHDLALTHEMAHPSPRTARLGALVGRWRTEGVVLGDAPVAVIGTDTYEWLP
jgi:hypothetical protein